MEQRAWLYRLGFSLWLCTCGYVAEQGASSEAAKYNAALGRPTWQSSWQYEGNQNLGAKPDYGKSLKAVDGKTYRNFARDSCTHTAGAATGTIYWSVDLGAPRRVQSVKLYNRVSASRRLQRFTIYGTTDGHTPEDAYEKQTCASQTTPALGRGASKDFTCNGKLIARFIIVEKERFGRGGENILSLCEAEVYVCSDQNCAHCTETRCEACDRGYGMTRGRCTVCRDGFYGNCRYKCSGHCKDQVYCDKVSGNCPNQECEPGYSGIKCSVVCHDGSYGDRCAQTCPSTCRNPQECHHVLGYCPVCADGYTGHMCEHSCTSNCRTQVCDQVTGYCLACTNGFTGEKCENACPLGKYGEDCAGVCSGHCADRDGNNCDNRDGSCLSCQPGYQGDKCDSKCQAGSYGDGCERSCSSNCRNPHDCDHVTGHCPCDDGFTGEKCEEACPLGSYGRGCAKMCSGHCANEDGNNCHNIYGTCQPCQPGYQGEKCDRECISRKYGQDCHYDCSAGCQVSSECHHVTGHCDCGEGYKGDTCMEKCSKDNFKYGKNCASKCSTNCGGNERCDIITGRCDEPCKAGYKGALCSSACSMGKYGENCAHNCSANCVYSWCERASGTCRKGCYAGYQGNTCNQSCSVGFYGEGCKERCSGHCQGGAACHHKDGSCTADSEGVRCEAGYKGDTCNTKIAAGNRTMMFAMVLIVLIVLGVAMLVVVLLFARKYLGWKAKPKKSARNKLKTFHNNNREDVESRRGGSSLPPSRPPPPPSSQSSRGKPHTTPKPPITPKPVGKNKLNLEISTNSASLYENAANSIEDKDSAVTTYIKLNDIGAYIKRKRNLLQAEYKSIPSEVHPCFYGISAKLKDKNRYKNIIPYDKNRVKLQQKGANKLSDYINASFVKDYRGKVAYIAALGTTGMTLTDFWRMIWEQEVEVIVMVTQLMEEDRMKCVQYWPADRENRYGDVKVEIQDTENTPYYVLRSYQMSQGNKSRVIRHYQYTCWPDKGVPERGTGLSQLREIMKQHREAHTSPILVHCSAGVGRTGTLIALDILLDQAAAEQAVDIYKTVCDLRDQRTNMVQTMDQYEYLHDFLHEVLTVKKTVIACDRLEGFLQSQESQGVLQRQYQFLWDSQRGLSIIEKQIFREDRNRNRYSQIVPVDVKRAKIPRYPEIYVNAAYVEGYKEKTAYVSTQVPMATTAADFWHLMYDLKCTSLVCLQQDKQYTQWLPVAGDSINHGQYTIMCVTVIQADGVTERQLTIKLHKEDKVEYSNTNTRDSVKEEESAPLELRVYELPAWNRSTGGDVATSVINLYGEVQRWQQRNTNKLITVMCMDGATESGLLLACWHLFDMANIEQELDVFHVVKLIRKSRPQFVPSLAQYRQIHSVVKQYIDSFGSYSNFRVMDR